MTGEPVRTPSNPPGLRDLTFKLPKVTPKARERARAIFEALRERYPDAKCALDFGSPHELLIATILSAQSTDAGVNKATPALFRAFPTPLDFARAAPAEIEPYVRTIGLFRNKSRAIHAAMKSVVEDFGGEVPRTMEGLLTLRGVARKTANVVLGNAFGINEGVVVDTHVERLAKRYGLAPVGATVAMVERRLMALFPRGTWWLVPHLLISHGRAVCKARGAGCAEDPICRRFCSNAKASKPQSKKSARGKKPRPRMPASVS